MTVFFPFYISGVMKIDQTEMHDLIVAWRGEITTALREGRRSEGVPARLMAMLKHIVRGVLMRRNFALYPFVVDKTLHGWSYEYALEVLRFRYDIDQENPRPMSYVNTCVGFLALRAVKSFYALRAEHPDAADEELIPFVGRGIDWSMRKSFTHLL